MTAATPLRPSPVELVRAALSRVDAGLGDALGALRELEDGALAEVSSGECRELLDAAERAKRRAEAVRLRVIAVSERAGAHATGGFTDVSAWVSTRAGTNRPTAAADAAVALALGEEVPADASDESAGDGSAGAGTAGAGTASDGTTEGANGGAGAAGGDADGTDGAPGGAGDAAAAPERARRPVARALDVGDISADHAKVILRALSDLPGDVSDAERHTCECELVRLAGGRSPAQLRKAARRVTEVLERGQAAVDAAENGIVAVTEAEARRRSAFWIKDNHDGTMTGQFTVPWLEGATLKKIIDSMTAPRRSSRSSTVRATEAAADGGSVESGPVVGVRGTGPGRGSHEAGPDGDFVASRPGDAVAGCVPGDVMASVAPVSRTEAEDWKDAQLDWQHRRGGAFADLLRRIPTDHLHPKTAATVLVSVDLETLTGEVQQVAGTDLGDVMSAGEVRRLACESGIIPAVLGGESLPLDLGRQRRFHSEAQRMALSLLYDSCVAAGCDRPFAWSEIHHLTAWRDGGETRADDGVPLCGTHHHWVDDPECSHEVIRDDAGRVTIRFRRSPEAA